MNTSNQHSNDKAHVARALEASIQIGLIGLFVGAIVFSAGYKLFLIWLKEETEPEPEPIKSE